MKVAPVIHPGSPGINPAHEAALPFGLVGFPEHRRMELVFLPEQLPFLWMRLHGPEPLHFIVIEPGGIIADYEPELFDEDAAALGLEAPEDAMVLNIVCLHRDRPHEATVNLIGPVIINRRTGVGKQVVLANHGRYSAHHPLVGETAACAAQA
ncbi:MAG: flagellar assembly protein FliW [Opitutaceae bacterium]|nr:flagellar assembly protein FliW [Opitutaceae bacterium]